MYFKRILMTFLIFIIFQHILFKYLLKKKLKQAWNFISFNVLIIFPFQKISKTNLNIFQSFDTMLTPFWNG